MTVFDRPLRSDRLVRAWLLVVLVALFVLLPRYVTWGAPFSRPLTLQLVGALLQVALMAALLLALLALGRWALGSQAAPGCGRGSGPPGGPAGAPVTGH